MESSCYDLVVKQVYTFIDKIHAYRYKYIFRVKPQCAHRIIKRGYMNNKENLSFGSSIDFDRAFIGYQSPYKS